jgi:hypothetical protein
LTGPSPPEKEDHRDLLPAVAMEMAGDAPGQAPTSRRRSGLALTNLPDRASEHVAESDPMVVSLDFLSQVPRLLRELTAIVQEPMDRRRQRRSEFFDREIVPVHEDMAAINQDYMESFAELLKLLDSQDGSERTIELLKKRRLVMLSTRKDREAFAEALANVRKTSYIKQRELTSFLEYDQAIRRYLFSASPADARVSWYTAFIDAFESMTRRGESPFDHFSAIETSKPPAAIIREAYSAAVHTDIPEAWRHYSGAYHGLRLELKR